jgi:choline monooxygenase
VPVLVTRADDGVLRAFLNVCRHRGSLLVEGEGRRATIQCPYHAWTYALDGSLRAAPRAREEGGVDTDALGLLPLPLDTWGPFVFVDPDPDAPPLGDVLGDLPERVAAAGVDVDALVWHSRATSTYAANWKLCCENYLECYHCRVAHPGLVEVLDVSAEAYGLDESAWFSTQVGPLRDGARAGFALDGPVSRGQFHFVFPNLTINVAPGRQNLSLGPALPDGPERTTRFLDYFFAPGTEEQWIAEYLAWDDRVGAEDAALVQRVQRGLGSGLLDSGVLLPESERLIAHFDRLVAAALA